MQAIDQLYTGILEKDVRGVQAGMRANQRVFNFGRLTWRMVAETEMSMMQDSIEARRSRPIRRNSRPTLKPRRNFCHPWPRGFDQASQLFADIYATSYPPLEKATTAGDNVEALRMSYAMAARTSELRQRMVEITTDMDKDIQTPFRRCHRPSSPKR